MNYVNDYKYFNSPEYFIENFDEIVFNSAKKLNESLKDDFETELKDIKIKRLGEYDEKKYRQYLIKLCLYTSKLDELNNDTLGAKIIKDGYSGGLIKIFNHLIEKCAEYSIIDKSIDEFSKYLSKDLLKKSKEIKTEIEKLEQDKNYNDYNRIFTLFESTKTVVNRFAEYNLISKHEALAKKFKMEDVNKIANLNYFLQEVVLPLLFRCYNISYWLNEGGYEKVDLKFQHPSEEEIAEALNICLKDVPKSQMGKLLYFSEGNEKLDNNVYIFSLPAGKACPNATNCKTTVVVDEFFKKSTLKKLAGNKFTCYGAQGQSLYPTKYYNAMVNFKILKELCTSVEDKTKVLNTMVNGFSDNSIVRVHDAGDFFSSDYLSAWLNVAELHPKILFYAYTTSINFLKIVSEKRGSLPINFVFSESEENLTRLFKSDTEDIINSIKEKGVLKTRILFNTFKEAEERGLKIDINDTLAMRGDISEFGLLIHGNQQVGEQRIYADKFTYLNSFPNNKQTLIKLYYKLPKKYKDKIDKFYDDKNINTRDKIKKYINDNFQDIKNYILDNNIMPDKLNIQEIIDTVINKDKIINSDQNDLLVAYIQNEIQKILNINKDLTKNEVKEIIKTKVENAMELI
jgi:hypothetical protein